MLLRSTVLLLLTFTALPQSFADSLDCAAIRRVVPAYFYAIGENRLEEAMSYYHADSPDADAARRLLMIGQSAYLQRTSILSLDLVQHDDEQAVVLATHRHLRIAGIKFLEELAETRYVLRRQGDAWKLWFSTDRLENSK